MRKSDKIIKEYLASEPMSVDTQIVLLCKQGKYRNSYLLLLKQFKYCIQNNMLDENYLILKQELIKLLDEETITELEDLENANGRNKRQTEGSI